MDRYALFAWDTYYPSGGWNDFVRTYDSIEQAASAGPKEGRDHWQIVDLTTGMVVELE